VSSLSPVSRRTHSLAVHHSRQTVVSGARAAVVTFGVLALGAAASHLGAQDCTGISQASDAQLTTVLVATGLTRPVFVASPPGDLERLFVVEQDGEILVLRNGAVLATPFLEISALVHSPADGGHDEEGLLGLAFHPDYAANGTFFVFHTADFGANNLVVRYQRDAVDPDLADPGSRQVVLTIPHPSFDNHNGGMIAFGPDGYLYIGTGDGGSGCDPNDNAQSGSSLLGKLLRLDVDTPPYAIPPDNPFAGPDGIRDEIWATGLRNPWRFGFDAGSGDLYIGDVGQSVREELDFQPAGSPGGENYGWNLYEGFDCPNPSCGSSTCTVPGYVPPILDYIHSGCCTCAVTGGVVYRGCRMPNLRGTYFYADYCSAFVGSFRMSGGLLLDWRDRTTELRPEPGLLLGEIAALGVDGRGEIHFVDLGSFVPEPGGEIYKLVPVLSALEVSGPGAAMLQVSTGTWSWEDLAATTSHPITQYRVYRADGGGSGLFACVHQSADAAWIGGDPASPASREVFSYLITATISSGEETFPGTGSGGILRSLSPAACPP